MGVYSVIYGYVLTQLMREAGEDQAPRGHHPAPTPTPLWPRTGPSHSRSGLQQYWHEQGYPAARFWTEPLDERFAKIGTHEVYQVKCNLVNRLPPRHRGESD
jgi:hypothetical protein